MSTSSYPTPEEQKLVNFAEEVMTKIMSQYDPSHDALHGTRLSAMFDVYHAF